MDRNIAHPDRNQLENGRSDEQTIGGTEKRPPPRNNKAVVFDPTIDFTFW
ncbi:hypothetical protein KFU94_57525 [Chloroflexi bacterium TSY]|nr:hypothetical protein [Chloroflexi bacterium TSY]